MKLLPLLLVAQVLQVAPLLAQTQPVRVLNRATISATALFIAPTGSATWSGNLLGGQFLPPGGIIAVHPGDGAGCRFDLRLVLRDGRDVLRQDIDVCTERTVAMSPSPVAAPEPPASPAAPPSPGGPRSRP